MDIGRATQYILETNNIKTKEELDVWCNGTGRYRFYAEVRRLAPDHYDRITHPEASIRAAYERLLIGYKMGPAHPAPVAVDGAGAAVPPFTPPTSVTEENAPAAEGDAPVAEEEDVPAEEEDAPWECGQYLPVHVPEVTVVKQVWIYAF